ncbi:MAG: transglutaminase TgpA family protein [Pseudonocardiaceae bacterium]
MTGWTARALPAAVAGLAVAFAATSLTGVLAGGRWWGFVVLSIAVVTAAGVLLRWLRLPPIVTAVGQLAALVGLVTVVFTSSGKLGVLPGSAARAQLADVLARAAQQIRVGVPPVPESTELLCLVVVVIGLVAIAVDILAVSAGAPASAGLVLLCVVTVPAATSDRMLPWWSFALSAVGFALLLAVDTERRQRGWGEAVDSSDSAASAGVWPGRQLTAAPAAVGVSAGALVVALLIGATVTAVGSARPISTSDRTKVPINGIGLNPFTSLRGQLSTEEAVSLLRVRGLGQRAYLRALTLSRFTNGVGWQQGPLDPAVPAGDETTERLPLPAGVATPVSGSTVRVEIEPISYADNWLPSFGYPLSLGGISPDWRYDPNAITVFSPHRQRAEPYTELGVLPTADPQILRAAGPAGSAPFTAVDPRYLETGGVDQRVVQLAAHLTAGTRTAFDATVALNRWFTQPSNGFRYDLRTAPGNSGDALVDFLFTGHRGYCEQFASAMAIMLRTLRVPARVAVGFTSGTVTGGSRLITTDDAHAWVEAWFPGAGWLPFDPTPLSDGRTVPPPYVATDPNPPTALALPPEPPAAAVPTPAPSAPAVAAPGRNVSDSGLPPGIRIGLTVTALLGLSALAGLAPLGLREIQRRRRRYLVSTGGPRAVSAAWEEVLAESADRGVVPPVGETVRASAQRLVREHGLDEAGQAGLHTLVSAVERSWYASAVDSAQQLRASPTLRDGGPQRDDHRPSGHDHELREAMGALLASMALSAPLTRTARLLPRSALPQHRTR